MKSLKNIAFALFALLIAVSCSSDDNVPSFVNNVLIINEGNFTSAEGSISGFSTTSDAEELGLYESANGFQIAATVQNMVQSGSNYFMVCNNPDKIEMLNINLQLQGSINTGLTTPYSLAVVGNKIYVSNWGTYNPSTYGYDNSSIVVIDLATFSITKTLAWSNQPQNLLAVGDKLYITNADASLISILDTNTDEVIDNIVTPFGPDKMGLDVNGKMWVICRSGSLVKIDISSNVVLSTFNVTTSGYNEKMIFNANRDKLYYLSTEYEPDFSTITSVFEFDINTSTVPSVPIISGTTFYGIGISTQNELYVGDHNNYLGNGTVYIYDLDGTKLNEFESGIVPNGFIFR